MARRSENGEKAGYPTLDRGWFPRFFWPQQNQISYQFISNFLSVLSVQFLSVISLSVWPEI